MRRAAFALVALAVAACGGGAGAGRKSGVASNFSAVDTAGRNFQLKDHLGKNVVYVDFWATFCQPCLAAMPHLKGMHEKYGPKGFTVVAVSMDGPESIGDVRAFVERNKLPLQPAQKRAATDQVDPTCQQVLCEFWRCDT